jgi:5-hydroxyisourate hydrolase-like protein (transthyretin family)
MRVDVTPRHAEILPGVPLQVTVNISNTSTVIGGYSLRVLGADPSWVEVPDERISLFPDETGSVTITFTPPEGLPAGTRIVAIQVREWTPPEGSSIVELELEVPSRKDVQLRVDPLMITAGKQANFGLIVENTGNTVVEGVLAGDDPEAQARFEFEPETVSLVPGERALVDMRVRAKRRKFGLPIVRVLGLFLDDAPVGFFAEAEAPAAPGPSGAAANPEAAQPIAREEGTQLAYATFVQKPVVSRGLLSLAGLLAAMTVFAIVITIAMSRLVSQSAADRDLALQVAAARNQTATGTAAVSGTVRLLTTGAPAAAVSVNVFSIDNVQVPVATTATNSEGQYHVANLAAGAYKLSFRGAGFVQIWYPGAADDSTATPVVLTADQTQDGVDVLVGGVPATVTGKVTGDDVSASTLYLMKPTNTSTSTTTGSGGSGTTTQDNSSTAVGPQAPPDNGDAIVQQIPVGSDGTFSLDNVPSPSVYDLVVTKVGYATATQRVDIGAGETRSGLVISLSKGDGLISGIVNSPTGPLGGATITATTGTITVPTVSLSAGSTGGEGTFTLRGLPTPASFTVTASANGYASQTQTVTLAAGQKLTGLSITLTKSAGSLSGVVTQLPSNTPAGGVQVTITNGQLTVQTETQSSATSAGAGQVQANAQVTNGAGQAVGHWTVGGLPIPGTYTVTFSRPDLASQTVGVSLDAAGNVTQGSQGATVDSEGRITVGMKSSTAVVRGVVKQCGSAVQSCTPAHATTPVGEVTVTLSSGTASYTVTTASVPSSQLGHFQVGNIPPGTWTVSVQRAGTSPTSTIISLRAGDVYEYDPALAAPASISGVVLGTDGTTPRGGWWVYVYRADQYPTVVSYSAQTDASGNFEIPAVDAPQNYVIVVQPTAASAQAYAVTQPVKASENVTLTIKADPAK